MDNNFNQQGTEENNQNENSSNSFDFGSSSDVNYSAGTVQESNNNNNNIKNMIIGLVAAFIVAVLGVVLYCVIASSTGMVFFIMGAVILAVEVFIYGKITGRLDPIGLIVCVVLALIAIYLGTKMGTIYAIKDEYNYETYKNAKVLFDINIELNSAFKNEYIKNMASGYVVSVIYGIFYIVNKRKRGK